MKVLRIEDMVRGWFVGGFEPTAHYTKDFEVGYRVHERGSQDHHFHTDVTEVNLLVSGSLRMHNRVLTAGDIFILEPWEITNPEFLEDSGVICVKFPSMNDKRPLVLPDPAE